MMIYKIVLCLVVFGAVTGMVNSLNLYPLTAPDTGNEGVSEAQVTEMAGTMSNSPLNAFTSYFVIMMLINILVTIFISLITIIPFLVAWGIPIELATAIQIPIWTVMAWGLWEMWTGQTPPAQD